MPASTQLGSWKITRLPGPTRGHAARRRESGGPVDVGERAVPRPHRGPRSEPDVAHAAEAVGHHLSEGGIGPPSLGEVPVPQVLRDRAQEPPGPDPLEDVRRAFLSFYEFSKDHPEHYALMFVDRSVPRISRDWERFGFVHEMQGKVAAMIQRAIDAGIFPPGTDAAAAVLVLVAAVHGAAAMRLCERLAHSESGDALARDTLEAAIAGLRAGITQTFRADTCH